MTVCKASEPVTFGSSWRPRTSLPRRCRSKRVSENCKQMERAHDQTASSPHPSPPEEERERISQTRSKDFCNRLLGVTESGLPVWLFSSANHRAHGLIFGRDN